MYRIRHLNRALLVCIIVNIVDAQETTVVNSTFAAKNVNEKQNTPAVKQKYRVDNDYIGIKAHNSIDFLPNRTICGLLSDEDRIFGGENAALDEFPWLARIKYLLNNGKEVYACAGSLITNNYVLTAAHCAVNLTIKEVRLGDWNTDTQPDCQGRVCNDPEVDVLITQVYIYPEYSKSDTFKGDIALLQLQKPVQFSDFIRPICLPTTEEIIKQDNSSESVFWTAGWGKTEYERKSNIKQKLALNAVPIDYCRKNRQ
ncbi:hypothetical protein evm_007889 [Chilo suppressalis]|nr:hypothetical protein evm_007889 [Chilo suppressalis]